MKVLREREGIPDLRRAARYRYASVTLPEVCLNTTMLFGDIYDAIVLYICCGERN